MLRAPLYDDGKDAPLLRAAFPCAAARVPYDHNLTLQERAQ